VILRNRTEALELHPTAVVTLAVKAKQKSSRESIEISLAWKNDG
jgi:amphi-Trp domain-containing protein